jgi:hypothetical protein
MPSTPLYQILQRPDAKLKWNNYSPVWAWFVPEDAGDTFLRNAANNLHNCRVTTQKTAIENFNAVKISNFR